MEPQAMTNLGGIKYTPDGTEYALTLGAATAIPSVYMPDEFFNRSPVYYQRHIPDCGANAGAFINGYLSDKENVYSPDYQWIDIKTFDGYPLSAGTDMKAILKSLTNGSLPYAELPEQTDLPLSTFSSTSRVNAQMKADAANHTIATYGFHTEPLTMQDLKSLIYTNKALLVLVEIGDEFWTAANGTTSWAESDILPLRTPTNTVSGHFIVLGAYDENYIYFANWWSDQWGRKGYGYFGENYLPQVLQVGTVVDSPEKVQIPVFARDLYLGMMGDDVRLLQEYLNKKGFLVASYGPGSPGQETTNFGPRTQSALIRFQIANGIKPAAGYFGPLTRAFITKNP